MNSDGIIRLFCFRNKTEVVNRDARERCKSVSRKGNRLGCWQVTVNQRFEQKPATAAVNGNKSKEEHSMVCHHLSKFVSANRKRLVEPMLLVVIGSLALTQAFSQTGNSGVQRNASPNGDTHHSSGCGSDEQIQFNQAGACGGDSSFIFDYTNKIIGGGPAVKAYLPFSSTPTTVPTLQISTGTPFLFQPGFRPALNGGETLYTGMGWSSTFTDNAPPYGSATQGMDVPLNIYKGYSPSTPGPSAYVLGANILLETDPYYTGDSTQSYLSPLEVDTNIQSPAHFGQVYGLTMQTGAMVQNGETVTIDDLRKIYVETLLGAGGTATYNIGKLVGLNLATQGFLGAQNGRIGTSWALNIEGPRLGSGSAVIQNHYGIRLASQSQGNPGGRNPNAWAIHEDDATDQNAFGKIHLGGESGPLVSTGVGSPEGVVTSIVGGVYTRQDGGPGTTLYVKESGSGNTGWVAK